VKNKFSSSLSQFQQHIRTGLVSLSFVGVASLTALLNPSAAQAQSYMNITVGVPVAPGVYGQISVGNNPMPPIINTAPRVVGQPVYGAPPMYLYVSDMEYRNWGRYCRRYQACGRPVYFVRVDERNRWWDGHHDGHGGDRFDRPGERRGWDRDEHGRGPGHRGDDRGEHGRGEGRGEGRGRGDH
jgi:hypothetical protein